MKTTGTLININQIPPKGTTSDLIWEAVQALEGDQHMAYKIEKPSPEQVTQLRNQLKREGNDLEFTVRRGDGYLFLKRSEK